MNRDGCVVFSSQGYASFSFGRESAPLSSLHYLGASKGSVVDLGIEIEHLLFPYLSRFVVDLGIEIEHLLFVVYIGSIGSQIQHLLIPLSTKFQI